MVASADPSAVDPSVYQDYVHHSNGQRTCTVAVITASLASQHPDHYVTSVVEGSCDLRGFANAGHASIDLDGTAESITAKRYTPKPTRWSTVPDGVSDTFSFGKHKYTWEGKSFLAYLVECSQGPNCTMNCWFILHPKGPEASANVDGLILAACRFSQNVHEEILVYDRARWSKDPALWNAIKGSSWDDVILDEEIKKGIQRDIEGFFKSKDSYKRYGIAWKRGIILYGVPGNGKTISIKALINNLANRSQPIPTLYVKSLKSPYGPQVSVGQVFERARSMAPCCLVLEDIDSLITDEVRSYFLNEVDGLSDNDGLLILGTTNHREYSTLLLSCPRPAKSTCVQGAK